MSLRLPVLALVTLSTVASSQDAPTARPSREAAQQPSPQPPAQPAEPRFESLFDGTTLDGWVTRGGRYDGDAVWTVEDGAITGRQGSGGAGGLLYTERAYTNFVLRCEARVSYPFDSGIFVRMVPPGGGKGAQVTIDHHPEGEIGAIYADGFLRHNKSAARAFARDDWNRFEVRCVGSTFRLQVWMNGDLITDYRLPPGTEGYAAAGKIGLQVHGGGSAPADAKAQFRKVEILELPEFDDSEFRCDDRGVLELTAAGRASGWRRVLHDADLGGFEVIGDPRGYVVRDGELRFAGGAGYLRTAGADYGDFELRLDFRGAGSAVLLRGLPGAEPPARSGCEIAIVGEPRAEREAGATFDVRADRSPAAWNSLRAVVRGAHLRVEVNGRKEYDLDTDALQTEAEASRGFLGFRGPAQADSSRGSSARAALRNIYVRRITAANTSEGK